MLTRVQPINPTRIAAPFDHDDFVFELKHGGFRAVAYVEDGACQLVSRKQIVYVREIQKTRRVRCVAINGSLSDAKPCAIEQRPKIAIQGSLRLLID
jgi:ATP-dependent DNA ligase